MRLTIISMCFVFSVGFFFVAGSSFVEAQTTQSCTGFGGFVPLACFNESQKLSSLYQEGDLANFMSKLFIGALSVGAILAVLRLAWAGFVYMSSDLWSQKGHAKEIIQETLLGLFLLLAIWIILSTINPDILKLKVEPKKTAPTAAQNIPQQPAFQDIDPNAFRAPTPLWTPSNAPPGTVSGTSDDNPTTP